MEPGISLGLMPVAGHLLLCPIQVPTPMQNAEDGHGISGAIAPPCAVKQDWFFSGDNVEHLLEFLAERQFIGSPLEYRHLNPEFSSGFMGLGSTSKAYDALDTVTLVEVFDEPLVGPSGAVKSPRYDHIEIVSFFWISQCPRNALAV